MKLLRIALMGMGAVAIASAVVNVYAAYQLIEPADEAQLGITRNEIVLGYVGMFLMGAALIWIGWRIKPKKVPPLLR